MNKNLKVLIRFGLLFLLVLLVIPNMVDAKAQTTYTVPTSQFGGKTITINEDANYPIGDKTGDCFTLPKPGAGVLLNLAAKYDISKGIPITDYGSPEYKTITTPNKDYDNKKPISEDNQLSIETQELTGYKTMYQPTDKPSLFCPDLYSDRVYHIGFNSTIVTITSFTVGTCVNCTNQASGVMLANSITALVQLQGVVDTTGLQLLFPFNSLDSNLTYTPDYSGYNNNGNVINALYNYSFLDLKGTPSYINVSINSNSTKNMSFLFWIMMNNNQTREYTDIITMKNYQTQSAIFIIEEFQSSGLSMNINVKNSTSGTINTYGPVSSFIIGKWVQLGITLTYYEDIDKTNITVYKNGILANKYQFGGFLLNGVMIYTIGAETNQFKWINSSIDEVQIHNRSLSAAEILAIYNAGLYVLSPGYGEYTTPTINLTNGSILVLAHLFNVSITCNDCNGDKGINVSARTSLDNVTWSDWSNITRVNSTTSADLSTLANGAYVQFAFRTFTSSLNSSPELTGYNYESDTYSTSPTFDQYPPNIITRYSQSFAIQINVTDLDNATLIWDSNSTLLLVNQTGFEVNSTYSIADIGNWNIKINVSDGVNVINGTFNLEILSFTILINHPNTTEIYIYTGYYNISYVLNGTQPPINITILLLQPDSTTYKLSTSQVLTDGDYGFIWNTIGLRQGVYRLNITALDNLEGIASVETDEFYLEPIGESDKMILGVLILIPLFLSLILLIGAATLNGEEHPALKIFFFLLSFVPFFVAINWGIIVLSKYFIIDELIDSMGETTYWVMIVFVVIIFYFIAYWIYKIIGMMAQKKEERIEY